MNWEQTIAFLRELNIYTVLIRLVLAALLGGLIGLEREHSGHPAGFRTHILVCVGAAMTIMTGLFSVEVLKYASDPLRIGAQVVSGIGFLGAGTILVTTQHNVKGLTTAAALWSVAAIGLAVGIGFYEGAAICALLVFFAVSRLRRRSGKQKRYYNVYMEIIGFLNINDVMDKINGLDIHLLNMNVVSAKSGGQNHVGIEATIKGRRHKTVPELLNAINEIENVAFIIRIE